MKKLNVIITILLVITIISGAVAATILSNDKYHLVALALLRGYEVTAVTDEYVRFTTDTHFVTICSFKWGIKEFKRGAY